MSSYQEFKRDLRWLAIIALLAWVFLEWFAVGYDSTDGSRRSGLGLYTDAMTGCQYLSAGGSGITPRMDGNGRHVCGVAK